MEIIEIKIVRDELLIRFSGNNYSSIKLKNRTLDEVIKSLELIKEDLLCQK